MRGQIQPWFNILDFESLESMMCLALKLKKDVWFSFFLATLKCKHNLHCCCFFGHLCSKFVSKSPFARIILMTLGFKVLQTREVRSMFI